MVLGTLTYYHVVSVSGWLIAAPVIYVFAKSIIYTMIRNAFHEALRSADADSYLDGIVEDSVREQAKRGLTPGLLDAALIEGSAA